MEKLIMNMNYKLPTDEEIEAAIVKIGKDVAKSMESYLTTYDAVRIVFLWLCHQNIIVAPNNKVRVSYLRIWGGLYISAFDILVAAELHPDICYRKKTFLQNTEFSYNVSKTAIIPIFNILDQIEMAGLHLNYRIHNHYSFQKLLSSQSIEVPS